MASVVLASFRVWPIFVVALMLFIIMFFFHRDPDRSPAGEGVLAPADGVVLMSSPEKIVIFMNHYNVHVNRSPVDGRVKQVEHRFGGHAPACYPSASKNEKNLVILKSPDGEIKLWQITGFLVRRIICYVEPGDWVKRGERIGMIRFGSRVEFNLPEKYKLTVKCGDRVRAGETVVAVKET